MHARLNRWHISCFNSHRAGLSIATMWVFPGFCLVLLFCFAFVGFVLLWFLFVLCVLLRMVAIAYGQYLDCDGSMPSFDTPKEETIEDAAQFVQLTQTLCCDLARAEKTTDGKKNTAGVFELCSKSRGSRDAVMRN